MQVLQPGDPTKMPFEIRNNIPVSYGDVVSSAGAVEPVTAASFAEKVLRASGPVAVEFMSYGCRGCRRAEPIVHDVARGLAGRVKIFQVNVAVERDLVQRYGIQETPTFVMFSGGREVHREVPGISAFSILNAISAPFGL